MGKTKKNLVNTENEVSIQRACKYIGSFAINMMKAEERQTLMNERLEELKNVKKGIRVVLEVTTKGIKVFDENETTVKMAHAIMRVAFSTCSSDARLFSYVAKSSSSSHSPSILQAHVFKTKKGSHAQQLSAIVSKAFKLAFTMATVKRKDNLSEFESTSKVMKQTSIEVKRRWAKKEIARGHEYSEHAERARQTNPLAMLPGPSHPIDKEMLHDQSRPRNVSNVEYDNRRLAQASRSSNDSTTERLVDAQIHKATEIFAVKVTPLAREQVAMAPLTKDQQHIPQVETIGYDDNDESHYAQVDERRREKPEIIPQERPEITSQMQPEMIPQGQVETSTPSKPEVAVGSDDFYQNLMQEPEGFYSNTNAPAAPDNIYQPLLHPPADYLVDDVGSMNVQNTDVTSTERSKVADVGKSAIEKGGDSSDDDELYLTVDELRQSEGQLASTDRKVLEDSYWYQPGLPRDIAEEMLAIAMPGTFFIRESTSNPGSYALSIRIPNTIKESGIGNILISQEPDGNFRIPGFKSSFLSLPRLAAYYAAFQDELPVKLRLTFDEDTSSSGIYDSVDGIISNAVVENEVAPAVAENEVAPAVASSPEEEAVAMIDAVLPDDPDYANFESCEPILEELNAQ